MHRITKGLDLPILGAPEQAIRPGPELQQVALLGADYHGMRPTMLVQPGDQVRIGQPLFEDKVTKGVTFTSPASGVLADVVRGDKRKFLGAVIEVSGEDSVEFAAPASDSLDACSAETLRELLVSGGLWTSFRTRPFSRIPAPDSAPRSIFVQAIDTAPLAADPLLVIRERERDFRFGLQALTKLTEGAVYLCRRPASVLPGEDHHRITVAEFEGPHPAGLPGTHIHLLDPVGPGKMVWTINYQDVLAIGALVTTGRLNPERVISVAGPSVHQPHLVRTVIGASIQSLIEGRLVDGEHRVISGSVLSGRTSEGANSFLGRYHMQVSVVPEGNQREFLGWVSPGADRFSVRNVFTSALNRARRFQFSTSTGGSRRAMVPIGMYEQVMPLDVIPTFLLRSLITKDTDQAQLLGCLELDEEDLGLCTFVCPGKYEYGPMLRDCLTTIEKDG